MVKTDFIQELLQQGNRDLSIEQGFIRIQHGQVGIHSQGVGWVSVDGKLLRGNIRSKGGFWLNLLGRILAEGRPG